MSKADPKWADAIVFGTPTRFGVVSSELKAYIDYLFVSQPYAATGPDHRAAGLRRPSPVQGGHALRRLLSASGQYNRPSTADDLEIACFEDDTGLDWFLLDDPRHAGVQALLRDLNGTYVGEPALHRGDCVPEGFQWSVLDDADQSVFAFLRFDSTGEAPPVPCVSNFTPVPRHGYRLGVPKAGRWREIVNTDAGSYDGSGIGNSGEVHAETAPHGNFPASVALTPPPLATLILRLN